MLEKKGDAIKLRAKEFLDKYNIEVEMKKEVEKIILCYASNVVLIKPVKADFQSSHKAPRSSLRVHASN